MCPFIQNGNKNWFYYRLVSRILPQAIKEFFYSLTMRAPEPITTVVCEMCVTEETHGRVNNSITPFV